MDKKNKNNLQSEKIRLEYENKKLREELKEFAKKLDLAVERKIYKKEKVKKEQTLMREIKDFEEIMKFYQ